MAKRITSSDSLPIDESFKLSAGPGAGKTHWLVNHIKDVVSKSIKLDVARKIACITYSNVAVNTLNSRINIGSDIIEVCTIHSFLYKNIFKPYVHLIAEEKKIHLDKLTLVEDIFSNKKSNLDNARSQETLKKYRELGYISFNDLLTLSTYLLEKYPNLYLLMSIKYPYIFIDEFQDTSPMLIQILTTLSNYGVVIGVVGDKEQTIYEFTGVQPDQFDKFSIQGMKEYEIHENRRSTKPIVELLNTMRTDFKQKCLNEAEGMVPELIIGDKNQCYEYCLRKCANENVQVLAFTNQTVNSMRPDASKHNSSRKLNFDFDNDTLRKLYLITWIKAIEYARMNDVTNTLSQLKVFKQDQTDIKAKLIMLLQNYHCYSKGNVLDLYMFLVNYIGFYIPEIFDSSTMGSYMNYSYSEAALGITIADPKSIYKTIHKSKGEEYDNVLLVLSNEQDLKFLTQSRVNYRLYYVAASRAKKRLFINVPTLDDESLYNELCRIPINILSYN
ncbi:ATP-dependent helicase [Anaerobiospirillum sp. NML120448]|uniref:ATP-dependent helicase n=1 Tax=Anaerobiospirillum sp. NML120448 TaxID=2932816 RepID=UPI001FF53D10|nr:ATP-dependent helicase [Anaerobiospirillum sp. NML120448]MCK0513922.1 ATP-dependent helicase [Anaerobiospirillum sp. NML120448]